MNYTYKGVIKVEFQILLEYLKCYSFIKSSLGIKGYHQIKELSKLYLLFKGIASDNLSGASCICMTYALLNDTYSPVLRLSKLARPYI